MTDATHTTVVFETDLLTARELAQDPNERWSIMRAIEARERAAEARGKAAEARGQAELERARLATAEVEQTTKLSLAEVEHRFALARLARIARTVEVAIIVAGVAALAVICR